MDNLNYSFFESFSCLDKLCGEIYNTKHGVTAYIDDMKAVSWSNYRHIPNWEVDLQQLIRVRHVRNFLAHTPGAFNDEICSQSDIDWIQKFHARILKQSDPMALLRQYIKKNDYQERETVKASRRSDSIFVAVAIASVFIILGIAIAFAFALRL